MTTDDDDTQLTPSHVWQPAFLGGPTNSLRAALSLTAVSTNEYNHYRMCLGITNVSGTNQLRKWMLPSVEGRFALRFLDNERKAVPLIESSQKSGKALADNLNIHHLGKMELACIDGIVPLTTNMAVQLADVNLDQHVRMPPPGDYRLEVQERLFQIAEDGRLIPISLPPVIANVKVLDQPSEMTFYLKQLVQQGKLFWGPALNSLRIGVTYDLNRPRGGNAVLVEVFLENLSTNDVRNLRLPRLEEQFDISLSDATGTEVPKTALGNQRGLPLTTQSATSGGASDFSRALGTLFGVGSPRRSSGFRPVFLSARDATSIGSFNLNEFFDVKSPGKYRLTYQQRLYQFGATNKLTGLTMPMVVVPIEIP
jgi:hypothetical protein